MYETIIRIMMISLILSYLIFNCIAVLSMIFGDYYLL